MTNMMSLDQMVELYRQEYMSKGLYPNIDDIIPYSPRGEYGFMSPATCPAKITKGLTGSIKVDVTTPGTPPYTFKVKRNDTEIYSYTGGATETQKIFPHTFNETAGAYTFKSYTLDSCPDGAKTSNVDSCSVTIEEPVVPPEEPVSPGMSPLPILIGLGLVGLFLVVKR